MNKSSGDVNFTEINADRIILRRFSDNDIDTFVKYRANPAIAKYQSWENFTFDNGKTFVQGMQAISPGIPGQWYQLAIEEKSSQKMIGDCAFCINADDNKQAEIGFTLAPEFHGKGFGKEAVTCMLKYIFKAFKLHRVIAITDVENKTSIALLESIGMRREGTFIEATFFKGHWSSEHLYAILSKDMIF